MAGAKSTKPKNIAEDSPFMTVQEVAKVLRMSTPSVYKALEAGEIPGFRVLSRWRCRRDQIMALGLPPRADDSR